MWRFASSPRTIEIMRLSVCNLKIRPHSARAATRLTSSVRPLLLCLLLAAVLGACGCATGRSGAQQSRYTWSVASGQGVSLSESETAAEFHILAGEMAVQRGMLEAAARHYVAALEYTASKDMARRATRIALFASELDLAYQAAREWGRLAPDSLDAQRSAARLALMQGEAEALLDYSRAVVAAAKTRSDGYRLLADLLSGKPRHGELAIKTLRKLAGAAADNATAWYALGVVALRYGQARTAADAARRALQLAPRRIEAALLQAASLIRLEKPARAQAVIETLPGSKAQRSRYHLSLAELLLGSGEAQAALDEFERALALQPDNANARFGLAVLALNLGKLERAEAAFKRLYRNNVRTQDAAFYLGIIHERREAYAAAEKWYRRVSEGDRVFEARVHAARMRARQGELAGARAAMDTLRAQYPNMSARLYAAEARMLFAVGRAQAALAVYDTALQKLPGNPDLLYSRSLVYEKLGRIEAAMADLQAILAQNPDSARALNALGYMLTNHSGRYDKALQLISRALELDPGNPAILDSLGWVHYQMGHLQKALEYLQRAYETFPDPEIAAHLGEVYWQLGRHDRARQIWRKSLSKNPGNTTLKKTMARLTP